jgi:hypothetical protein
LTEELRYPIGKFTIPAEWDAGNMAEWRANLAELPAKMRAAIAGLNDVQLDTPYRDGGWTVRQTVHHVADSHVNAYCRFRLALTEDARRRSRPISAQWAELPDAHTLPVAPSLSILDGVRRSCSRSSTPADTGTVAEPLRASGAWWHHDARADRRPLFLAQPAPRGAHYPASRPARVVRMLPFGVIFPDRTDGTRCS